MSSFYLLVFLVATFSDSSVYGHVPVFPDDDPSREKPMVLERPYDQSIAIYTQFESDDDIDVYEFTISENDLTHGSIEILIGTLVPSCEPLQDLLVSWVLVGPKQDVLDSTLDQKTQELVPLSQGNGALYTLNPTQGEVWEEPYTAHYYFKQKRSKINISKIGSYRIYVWSADGVRGDYVLEFGDKEIWPLQDILYTLWVYPVLLFEFEIVTKDCTTSPGK